MENDILKTILGTEVPLKTKGILYLCEFDYKTLTLKVGREIFFESISEAFDAYANIFNPESQLVYGKTFDKLIIELDKLHKNIENKEWLKELNECL
jgi:hypothetical protein